MHLDGFGKTYGLPYQAFDPGTQRGVFAFDLLRITGCEFLGEPKLLPLALVAAQSERRVQCPQKNAWHAGAASTTKCA